MRLLSLVAASLGAIPAFAGKVEYNRDIRPILTDTCFACHGPDSAARKADLRLDQREAAIKAGAFIPGQPEKSPLVERIHSTDKAEVMPPPKTNKVLTAKQKATLKQWIAEGAEYQPHWSFIAPVRPELPAVRNAGWVKNPIDRFVLAKLEAAGLTPAPEADRRAIARRLALDLTGLPPDPKEVDALVADTSANWYEKYVDTLMDRPTWGEHRGRYWLDAARYADTHGIHFDNFREVWAYREWVIKALNANMKFDQFTLEQLAGDLLPNATLDQQIASGFNRCNITSSEGGAIDEEYLVLYARDRTETVAQTWMALTAGCAVCHDHKFDPIKAKDFYAMSAFFNNTTQRAMDGNVQDTPPIVLVPRQEDRARWELLTKELASAKAKAEARKTAARADFDKWLATVKVDDFVPKIPTNGLTLHIPLSKGDGRVLDFIANGKPKSATLADGFAWEPGNGVGKAFSIKPGATLEVPDAGDFDTKQSFSYGAWVKIPNAAQTGSIFSRMDNAKAYRGWDLWYENGKIAAHLVDKWAGEALKIATKAALNPPAGWHHVFVTYDGSAKAAGLKIYIDGAVQPTDTQYETLKPGSSLKTDVPFKLGQRNASERMKELLIEDARVYDRRLDAPEVNGLAKGGRVGALLKKSDRTPPEKDELFTWWLATLDAEHKKLTAQVATIQKEEATIKTRGTIAHIMAEKKEPAMAHVLFRGEYDKRRDKVTPAVPEALPAFPSEFPKNRIGFAKWLLRPEHPLTSRVTVNRFWQELFGTALVRTAGDFGITGELPSHPELLDWLALEFRDGGWDIKKFFKLLVTSAAYRQSALATVEKVEKDPANRLISRGPRFRMDAEMVRDYALASSGLLVNKIGGPSVRPYQPEGVWEAVAMIGSNTRDYRKDSGENLYRRSMYTFWKRAAPPASMDIFNAPNRETCTVRRERTNTPLQALVTLNDPQFVEAARTLAERALKTGGDSSEAKLEFVAKHLLARPFTATELPVVKESLAELVAEYKSKPEEAKKLIAVGDSKADPKVAVDQLAAWTMLVNQLMNLDEVLNK